MKGVKKVLIHQIFDNLPNLQDTLDHFNPDYVFLLSCVEPRSEPKQAEECINQNNVKLLGKNVEDVEYCELIGIKKAWHNSTIKKVFEVLGQIKEKCEEMADGDRCEYYAGLSDAGDGGELITVGISHAAVLHDMKTYYTRARKAYYNEEYVIEIESLNKITQIQNWLKSTHNTRNNLQYLKAIIDLEKKGDREISSAKLADILPYTKRSVDNAMRVLMSKELIETEKKDGEKVLRNRIFCSTDLGKLIHKLNPLGNEEEE
ncbi:MAG: hypothetical protein VYA86_03400 [Candidatus Thermoplasmatota archaeon]|nr:hypothetical protein [Candidatus Thermoplasmatota archaeon]